jgi:hypothetical protein
VMNSIAGGGTMVTFPTLMLIGFPSIPANATNTVALLPGILSSVVGYRKNIHSTYRWLKLFAPVSLLGGLTGGILLVQTPSRVFDSFVPFLIADKYSIHEFPIFPYCCSIVFLKASHRPDSSYAVREY